ncbi:dihydrofolate reductase family protein [Nocardioides bizhenqiangii]|uniref:Dihydrofolate reductase family protein n=1 Tax=Nocardioides bizhenqiangii TaxID=3095076 RepID=A0ABZ0ZSU4_9ACTN|nr:dihydrofolate reductase family protein [Nocardioides sp. HM61]WQQ26991.1 dihydrofolate reductase family protein [Nocardioides sp. HM61]
MTNIIGDITMSLDGFVTGPGADLEHGLGRDAEGLHAWALDSKDSVDRSMLERLTAASGAVVMGRKTFDTVDGPDGWSAERGYGADQDGRPAFFVVTSTQPSHVRLADSHDFTFVLDGLGPAVEQARAAAGDRDVYVMGGGRTVGGCLAAGLLDQLRIHLSPEVLGAGTPLFDAVGRHRLRQVGVETSPVATHLTYEVFRG